MNPDDELLDKWALLYSLSLFPKVFSQNVEQVFTILENFCNKNVMNQYLLLIDVTVCLNCLYHHLLEKEVKARFYFLQRTAPCSLDVTVS